MKPTDVLPTSQVPTGETFQGAEVLPFAQRAAHLRTVAPTTLEGTAAVLELLETMKQIILRGEESPTAIVLVIIEEDGERAKSYGRSVGLNRMELIGNLHALAAEITMEAS